MRRAEAGDAHLQRAGLALSLAQAEEHIGPVVRADALGGPTAVAHLRFVGARAIGAASSRTTFSPDE